MYVDDEAPASTPAERIREQFCAWEERGRGWDIWDKPVCPEPAFQPFWGYRISQGPVVDDGRKPTFVTTLVDSLSRLLSGKKPPVPDTPIEASLDEPEPVWLDCESELVEWQIAAPQTLKVSRELAEQFILNVGSYSRPISFEIIGQANSVVVQLTCHENDAHHLRGQLEAHFPDAIISRSDGSLATAWQEIQSSASIVEFGLSHEFMLPLATRFGAGTDPLTGIVAALAGLEDHDLGLLQVMFEPIRHPWAESVLRAVTQSNGKPIFTGGRDLVSGLQEKIHRPLYGVVLRCAARSSNEDRAWDIVRGLAQTLAPLDSPIGNELIPLSNDLYPQEAHEEDVLYRRSRRSGMILNSDELISLVHVPSAAVRIPKLKRSARRTKKAPDSVINNSLVLGINEHHDTVETVSLDETQRGQHLHIVGVSGTGKSTCLLNMMVQDAEAGNAFALLDPHGDLIDEVLRRVPPERADDVILFDPADEEYPIGFNILSAHSELEQNLLASDLVAVFRRLSTSWGDQMNAVLANAILAMLESSVGGTLLDLRRFLVEKSFRYEFLKSVRDEEVTYYWTKQYPLLKGNSLGPVLTRLDTFLRPKTLRFMVAQKESKLDFADIMDNGKILLARLSHGAIGEENSYLLGTLLVSKFHQLAMGRQQIDVAKRRPFYLILDEAHHFATPSMASVLSGARKYRLGLVLAHQELHQVESRVPELASALSNAYTRICFRIGEQDAKKLESGFSSFEAADLQNLGTGEAICRVGRAEDDFNLRTPLTSPIDAENARRISEQVISRTRERYAVARGDVEATLAQSYVPAEPAEPKRRKKTAPAKAPCEVVQDVPENAVDATPQTEELTPLSVSQPKSTPGRGGVKHKSLQRLIKQWAEGMGYGAQIEKPILEGRGAVDVALYKATESIACEISITTPTEHECKNLTKCIEAGFTHIVMVSDDEKHLEQIREKVTSVIEDNAADRIYFVTPDKLFDFIKELEAKRQKQSPTIRGYHVTVNTSSPDPKHLRHRKQSIARTIADAAVRRRSREKSNETK